MEGVIYCHINKENGKMYIGLSKNINKRGRNGLGYLNNHHKVFAAAIAKYGGVATGDTAGTHKILEDNIESLEKANKREQYGISYYHTYVGDPKCGGYNCTTGGDGSKGHIMSKSEKEGRRQQRLGIPLPEKTKQKMSAVRKGKKQHLTKKKLEALHKAGLAMIEANKKKVKCIETGIIYSSLTEASKQNNIPKETIGACCRGLLKTAWGKHGIYIEKEK